MQFDMILRDILHCDFFIRSL